MGEKKLAWLLSALALALVAPASASAKGDFGDAPDGAGAGYSNSATLGSFPSLAANGGPQHKRVRALVLGAGESAEGDSRQVDRDSDDGVEPLLKACSAKSELRTVINAARLPKRKAKARDTFYVNAWFDWNRDGDWEDDDDRCAPEWAIENFPVSAAELERGILPLAIQFAAGSQVKELWYRVTLTRNEPVAFADAGGPAGGYAFGETEDYFVGGGGGDRFDAACKPNPKMMLHGRVGGTHFILPAKYAKKGSGLTASFIGKAGKGTFRRFKRKAGIPVGIRYAEARDGPTRIHRQTIRVKFRAAGKTLKTIKCKFVVAHTAPHKGGKKARKKAGGKDRWKHWRKRGWRWRHYRRPPRNPGVVLTEVPRNEPEGKPYAVTVKMQLRRSYLRKIKQRKYKRMQILLGRYKKLKPGKKTWAIPKSSRKSKLYKRYLKRCKLKALAAHRRHAGKSVGKGGPAVLDCPINWATKQKNFSFDLNLNPVDNAPIVIFLQDSSGKWFQPDRDNLPPIANPTFNPLEPIASLPVRFAANAFDPDGQVVKIEWDFDGNGSIDSVIADPTHAYSAEGAYQPRLTITDSDGASAEYRFFVTVQNFAPIVRFRFCRNPPEFGVCEDNDPNQTVQFDLNFAAPFSGFLIDLGSTRTIPGGNVVQPLPGFPCFPENGDGVNDVLRCPGPIQPGTQVSGLFQTSAPLNPCEPIMLFGIPEPGQPAPAPLPTRVAGPTPCSGLALPGP